VPCQFTDGDGWECSRNAACRDCLMCNRHCECEPCCS
jgi:hypothetical protein